MHLIAALALCLQWNEKADPVEDLAAACEKARDDNRRVLVAFGSGDEPSQVLADILKNSREIARKILYEYVLVYVYRKEIGLTILSSDAKEIAKAESLSVKSVLPFLEKHQCEPQKADDVLNSALDRAKNGRRVLLVFGAPW